VVVAYASGVEIGRDTARTATGPLTLRAETDRPRGGLAYVTLALTDAEGVVHTAADRPVTVEVTGDGLLLALGSADPSTEERFDGKTRTTYEGRALAVVRTTGEGTVSLLATAPGCEPAEVVV
jgi:beta-galactosidase